MERRGGFSGGGSRESRGSHSFSRGR
jgi:hypothetical protein